MKFAHLRQDYQKHALLETEIPVTPFELFHQWFEVAENAGQGETNAMVLSTLGLDQFPSNRVVLLKELDHGFVWFTNYDSDKGKELAAHPKASLLFFWPWMERQVRIQGMVEKISAIESDTYFKQRPFGSQVGALVSRQSSVLSTREELDMAFEKACQDWEGKELTRPARWGGYRLIPHYIEFWQGRPSRLHDRIFYRLQPTGNWNTGRLSP